MKQYLFLTVLLLMAACKPDEVQPVVHGNPISSLSARVNGVMWNAENVQMQQVNGGLDVYGGKNDPGKPASILIHLNHYQGLSTYTIDSATYTDLNGTYLARTGTLIVGTDNDIHLSGSFSFTATDGIVTKTITGGAFDIYK